MFRMIEKVFLTFYCRSPYILAFLRNLGPRSSCELHKTHPQWKIQTSAGGRRREPIHIFWRKNKIQELINFGLGRSPGGPTPLEPAMCPCPFQLGPLGETQNKWMDGWITTKAGMILSNDILSLSNQSTYLNR